VFHAGTALVDGALVASGGRVLNVTARGPSVTQAQRAAYAAVDALRRACSAAATSAGARWRARRAAEPRPQA
jgi:phosphoribosylamine--glycine ligase